MIEFPSVWVETGMFELAVRAQVVAARVRCATERALESAREMDVIVVPDVRHYFAAQLASVQVAAAWQLVERESHVPGF